MNHVTAQETRRCPRKRSARWRKIPSVCYRKVLVQKLMGDKKWKYYRMEKKTGLGNQVIWILFYHFLDVNNHFFTSLGFNLASKAGEGGWHCPFSSVGLHPISVRCLSPTWGPLNMSSRIWFCHRVSLEFPAKLQRDRNDFSSFCTPAFRFLRLFRVLSK